MKTFPTLYKKNSTGKTMYWTIVVMEDPDHSTAYQIVTRYGQTGGAEQIATDWINEGKNQGKANETTPLEQAVSEAESRWRKQINRKGYVQDLDQLESDSRPGAEPMLAHRYDQHAAKISFPCAVQPKLDGHRCIAVVRNGAVHLYSRQRKLITGLPHIERAILKLFGTMEITLDGELYNHTYKSRFEELTGYIRSEEPKPGHEAVEYHVYDIIRTGTFHRRWRALEMILSDSGTVQLVPTQMANGTDEVIEAFNTHRALGYEGSMLRNLESEYVGKRSYDLQKVKSFQDAEFEIVGVEEGRGKMAGHAIFICQTIRGKKFRAKMKGDMDRLIEYYQNAPAYIGRILTVQYQDWTADEVPRFPVALRFREDV